jgi:hypothetical protein
VKRREFIAGLGAAAWPLVAARPATRSRAAIAADTATNVKSPANRTGQRNAFKSGASGGYYFVRWEGGA